MKLDPTSLLFMPVYEASFNFLSSAIASRIDRNGTTEARAAEGDRMAVQQEHLTKSVPEPRNTTEDKTPVLSAEIFIIPLEADRYLIYAPLRRAAFIGNARVVNFLA